MGQERWQTVSSSFNDAGARTKIVYPSTFVLTHTRDAIHRLTALVDVGAGNDLQTVSLGAM